MTDPMEFDEESLAPPVEDSMPEATYEAEESNAAEEPNVAETQKVQLRREDDRPRILARYGLLGHIGVFAHARKMTFEAGSKLVLQTDRGIEIGQHIPLLSTEQRDQPIDAETARRCVELTGQERVQQREGRVIRVATEQDLSEERHINANIGEQLAYCQRLVEQHDLPMKLITCEHLFGGERMIFYFMAEGRVDFRQLVRDLAREYQTRIEMRQVGARDEARLVADYEICGRECCCKNFLKTLRPVSMKMAKMQKATLDPSKVSGRCGRLRCCLRYEHEVYNELNHRLARNNAWVRTPDGEGKVIDRQVITQWVTVELEDRRRVSYPMEEVEVLANKPPQQMQEPAEPARPKQTAADTPREPTDPYPGRERPRQDQRRTGSPSTAWTQERSDEQTPAQPELVESGLPVEEATDDVPPAVAEPIPRTKPRKESGPSAQPDGVDREEAEPAKSGKKRRSRERRRRRKSKKGSADGRPGAANPGNQKPESGGGQRRS